MPCPLIFPLESFCFEDVTVHETSLGMSQYIFLHNWGMLVKKVSQSIKVFGSSYSIIVKVVVISLSFQSSAPLFTNLSNNLVIVLRLMLPLCGMLSLKRFVPLPRWPPSESSSKPTCTPKHTHLSLDHSPGVLRRA